MGTMTYQITGLMSVYSTDYSGADQRKHQSSASLARVRRIHRWTVNSPHKGPVTRKIFPFDDVIMICFNWNCGNSTHQYVLLDIISCYRTTCISSQTVKIWIKRSISTRRHFQKNSWKDDVYILFQISLKFVYNSFDSHRRLCSSAAELEVILLPSCTNLMKLVRSSDHQKPAELKSFRRTQATQRSYCNNIGHLFIELMCLTDTLPVEFYCQGTHSLINVRIPWVFQ